MLEKESRNKTKKECADLNLESKIDGRHSFWVDTVAVSQKGRRKMVITLEANDSPALLA